MKSRKIISFLLVLVTVITLASSTVIVSAAGTSTKPRIIVTQDGECDDMNSFIRLLLYSNQYDIEGLILSSSQFHWEGNGTSVQAYRFTGRYWMYDYIDAYEAGYNNLLVHEEGFPTPDYLRGKVRIGNIESEGEMTKDTPGSNLIKSVLLDNDDRKVYIQAWGGANTIASALRSIKDTYYGTDQWDTIYKKVCDKAVIILALMQDNTWPSYIAVEWPDVMTMHSAGAAAAYSYLWPVAAAKRETFQGAWMRPNIQENNGPLMDYYLTWNDGTYYEGETAGNQFGTDPSLLTTWWGAFMFGARTQYDFISEGDSPCFMYFVDVGLRSTISTEYGGWGGRYVKGTYAQAPTAANYYVDTTDPNTDDHLIWPAGMFGAPPVSEATGRWVDAANRDLAVRADWLVTPNYADANHAPSVKVNGTTDLDIIARPGTEIVLNGSATDPDGDNVDLAWFYYWDAGTYGDDVPYEDDTDGKLTFTVPADAEDGDTIHMILTATDDGEQGLSRYQRVIVTVGEPNQPIGGGGGATTTYTVTFDSNGGSTVASQSIKSGETAGTPVNPTRAGYTFTGWYTDAACTDKYDFSTNVTRNLVLYAGWKKDDVHGSGYFTDDDGHWAEPYINALYAQGYVSGTGGTAYSPGDTLTRAQFVQMLYNAFAGGDTNSAKAPFGDVGQNQWYADAINWAYVNALVTGYTATEFYPDISVERQQMAAICVRAAEKFNITFPAANAKAAFADDASIASYAKAAVYTMQRAGILEGKENNRFDPAGLAVRAEAAKVMYFVLFHANKIAADFAV
ncbi:MAG: DUF1593 domain-containing protein [Oscillospiraceae bacterium]|jgi:uncharacterized repeat protein (TIGR02543 family)|nr:DUF1593 domain-containing protein [Oscillospiraceae bacterium]